MFYSIYARWRPGNTGFSRGAARKEIVVNVNHQFYMPNAQEVGVFPSTVKPVREGLYKRISAKGNIVWAYFTPGWGWGRFSSNKQRALDKRNNRSGKRLPWIGSAVQPKG